MQDGAAVHTGTLLVRSSGFSRIFKKTWQERECVLTPRVFRVCKVAIPGTSVRMALLDGGAPLWRDFAPLRLPLLPRDQPARLAETRRALTGFTHPHVPGRERRRQVRELRAGPETQARSWCGWRAGLFISARVF